MLGVPLRKSFEGSWFFELLVKDRLQITNFSLKGRLRFLVLDIDLQLVGLILAKYGLLCL